MVTKARRRRRKLPVPSAGLPNRLRKLRVDRKWTLFDVSLRTMIQPSVLSQYERGKLEVSPERAHLLAELFGVPVSEFWTPPTLADVAYPGVANG